MLLSVGVIWPYGLSIGICFRYGKKGKLMGEKFAVIRASRGRQFAEDSAPFDLVFSAIAIGLYIARLSPLKA